MSDDIALVLIKRIEALEQQVAELKQAQPAPLEWPALDLSPGDRQGFEPFSYTERS